MAYTEWQPLLGPRNEDAVSPNSSMSGWLRAGFCDEIAVQRPPMIASSYT